MRMWALARARGRVAAGVVRVLLGLATPVLGGGVAAAGEGWPANVKATYDINFNGFNVGTFEFQSQAEQTSYTLTANARLSILLGAFTWDSETRSFGVIANQVPKPANFTFDFKSTLLAGSTNIGFADGAVTRVTHLPPAIVKPDAIPLREQHLKGVLDPLSAIMAISRGSGQAPCDRRLPIFDGSERFDLVFSPKGEMKVVEQTPSGQPGIAYVCRVKYVPIAGHNVDAETKFMVANDEIEVALRPIPSANVYIPHQIKIPTLTGSASLVSKRVDIASPGKPQIALMY
jgi:hypothetical protein